MVRGDIAAWIVEHVVATTALLAVITLFVKNVVAVDIIAIVKKIIAIAITAIIEDVVALITAALVIFAEDIISSLTALNIAEYIPIVPP